jgi:hypothetical protein
MLAADARRRVHLVESNSRKACVPARPAQREIGAPPSSTIGRIEDVHRRLGRSRRRRQRAGARAARNRARSGSPALLLKAAPIGLFPKGRGG